MSDPSPVGPLQQNAGGAPRILLLAAVLLAAAGLAFFLRFGSARRESGPAALHLPSGPAELSYGAGIRVENVTLSRAENYLHQEVTTVKGNLVNPGDRSLQRVELTIEFFDQMHQVVLRHSFISSAPQAIPAKGSRDFEVSFEHIPSGWNMQDPAIRVAGLEFGRQDSR